jgi:hypothetical protein
VSGLPGLPFLESDATLRDYIPGQPIPVLIRDPRTGKVYTNPLKKFVIPYTLLIEPEVLTLGPGEVSDPIPMPIDGKGHFEIMQGFFHSSKAAGFSVMLFDPDNRPFLMNREVHVSTIASGLGTSTNYEAFGTAGAAGRAYRWPETFFMNVDSGGKAIFAQFRNLSTQSNTIRFALHGRRWYFAQAPSKISERMAEIYRTRMRTMPFFYTTEQFVRLTDGADPVNREVRFTDEAWTEVVRLSAFKSDATEFFDVRISEKATEKRYMETPLRDDLVFGDGEFPFLMWESSLFEPNYKLDFELEYNGTAPTLDVWLTLGCRKILFDPKDDKLLRPGQASGVL